MKTYFQKHGNFFLLTCSLILASFIWVACPEVDLTEPCDVTCGPNKELKQCVCVCKDGFVEYRGDCVPENNMIKTLSADISGQDVPKNFTYTPGGLDYTITRDSVIIDGYVDHIKDDSSSWVYFRLEKSELGQIQAGQTYRLDIINNYTYSVASSRYPFVPSNEIYFVDTGSVTINYMDPINQFIEADFSFKMSAGKTGEYRYIRGSVAIKPKQ